VDSLAGALIPATPLALVQQVWPSVVAALPIAHEASPTSVRDGVLNVTCSSSVYTEELALLATDVVSAVNGAVGEPIVRSLRARTG
jgi:predicted nucleic acid-binding Zn ribbon protein